MKNQFQQLYRDNLKRPAMPVNLTRNETGTATLYIYDVIDADWGVGAKDVIAALASIDGTPDLHIRINSPGGDVFEGRAIMAAIQRYEGKTTAHIDSLAASAATSIALAADEVVISQGAFFMIHNASGLVWGDKNAMRETADLLEKIEGAIVADYTGKTGADTAQVVAWMDAETWFNADEAVANGFCDRLTEAPKGAAKNAWNLAAFSNAPAALKAPPKEPEPVPEPEPCMTTANANRLKLLTIL